MNKKGLLKGLLAAVLSVTIATIFGSTSTYAEVAISQGLFTGEGDVRWEWKKITDPDNTEEPEQVSIMFYDKPAAATTIVVPSLSDVITAASASGALNTYYVRSADLEAQAANYTEAGQEKRVSTADVTVLDMTNTSKVQIMGVKPIINPETEVELIFGENMVIGDGEGELRLHISKRVTADVCTAFETYRPEGSYYDQTFCTQTEQRVFENAETRIPDYRLKYDSDLDRYLTWDEHEEYWQRSFTFDTVALGCRSISVDGFSPSNYNSQDCYIRTDKQLITKNIETIDTGVFAGYKLKLTNLENVKYLGWYAFQHTTLNEESRHITIKTNQTAGEGVFAWSNVNAVTFEGTEVFPAMFRDCSDLTSESIDFGNVETIGYNSFMNTNLGMIDFSNTNIKTIRGQAFRNAGLNNINLDGVQSIGYESFANNSLTELYLPKSLNDLNSAKTFAGNQITKLTVAYDTMLMNTPLHAVMMDTNDYMDSPVHTVKELILIAPYAADEEVAVGRLNYMDIINSRLGSSYGWNWDDDVNFAHADNYKNVVAPGYFNRFYLVENIAIGEGYEFVGGNAFFQYYTGVCSPAYGLDYLLNCSNRNPSKLKNVSFPESLKGIGTNSFAMHYGFDFRFNLPVGLEYIGNFAFANDAYNTMDFDLPNLRYLGTQAFWINGFRNITLHDSLEHVGYAPFMGSWNLHDLTIDYDVFRIGNLLTGGGEGVSSMGHFGVALTEHANSTYDVCEYASDAVVDDYYQRSETTHMAMNWGMCVKKVGTITFTEKAVTEPPFLNEENSHMGSVPTGAGWFYQMAAEKIDLSKTPWKKLTTGAFVGAAIDDLLLPENLEFIGGMAFVCSRIMNELHIPDTVKVINYDAFNAVYYWYSQGNYFDGTLENPAFYDENGNKLDGQPEQFAYMKPVKITKLPTSLEYVGYAAFIGDHLLTTDLDLPNLKIVGYSAFQSTRLRDVTLHSKVRNLFYGSFGIIPTLRNLTFDTDFWGIVPETKWEPISGCWSSDPKTCMYGRTIIDYDFEYSSIYPFFAAESNDREVETMFSVFNQATGDYWCDDYCIQWASQHESGTSYGTITFTNRNTTPLPESMFVGMVAENLDLGEAGWTTYPYGFLSNAVIKNKITVTKDMTKIPDGAFILSRAKEIELPEILTEIGDNSFMFADVKETLILPDTVRRIGRGAFGGHYSDDGDCSEYINYCVTGINKLPSSLKYVGDEAFFGNYKLEGDLDIPSLLSIGHAAFMKTNLRDITLHDSLQYIGEGAFMYNPNMRTITIDCDFFDINDGYDKQFYSIFGTLDRSRSNQYQSEDRGNFDSVIFTEKAVALPRHTSFAFLNIGSLDISKTKWDTIPSDMFIEAKIREPLVLPDSLKVIESGAFSDADWIHSRYQGNPDGDISKKTSVKIAELPASLEVIGTDAFRGYQYELDLDLPNLKSIGTSAFMQANVKSVKLRDKIESIGSGAFLYIPSLRDIVIDFDFFGIYQYGPYFYSAFSTVEPVLPVKLDTNWNPSQTQHINGSSFNSIVFTEKAATKPANSNFVYLDINSLDISRTGWTEIPYALFFETTIHEPLVLPETIETIADSAFLQSHLSIANELPEGLKTIGSGAFFAADCFDNLVIPSTVEYIGWSAFNAGPADVHYDSVIVKPANLSYSETSGQAVFQMLWNVKTDKLTIESETLPVINTLAKNPGVLDEYIENSGQYVCYNYGDTFKDSYCLNENNEVTPIKQMPEFHGLNVKEVELPNIRAITTNAFEDCAELEKVDFSSNSTLQFIGRNAFAYDNKLKTVIFDDVLSGKDVSIGEFAFRGTAIESIGGADADFNLEAANFNAEISKLEHNDESGVDEVVTETDSYVFAEMPKLKTVSVPTNFAYKNVPAYTFANNPELSKATLAWEIESLGDGAFLNDHKLAQLFVWGDTNIEETEEFNLGASGDEHNLTVPQETMIFAYSDAPAEAYANAESRSSYDGKFYALDEVLYLTANKNYVILNDDKTDFDKDGLKLYGLRRDGVILSSDWQTYDTAFQRTSLPEDAKNITFEEGRGALGPDDAAIAAEVFDARKPFEIISLANRNFENVTYELLQMPSGNNPIVAVHYPDGYTGNVRSATLFSKTKEQAIEGVTNTEPAPAPQPTPAPAPEEEDLVVPDTGTFGALAGAATSSLSIATIIVLGGLFIAKRRKN